MRRGASKAGPTDQEPLTPPRCRSCDVRQPFLRDVFNVISSFSNQSRDIAFLRRGFGGPCTDWIIFTPTSRKRGDGHLDVAGNVLQRGQQPRRIPKLGPGKASPSRKSNLKARVAATRGADATRVGREKRVPASWAESPPEFPRGCEPTGYACVMSVKTRIRMSASGLFVQDSEILRSRRDKDAEVRGGAEPCSLRRLPLPLPASGAPGVPGLVAVSPPPTLPLSSRGSSSASLISLPPDVTRHWISDFWPQTWERTSFCCLQAAAWGALVAAAAARGTVPHRVQPAAETGVSRILSLPCRGRPCFASDPASVAPACRSLSSR